MDSRGRSLIGSGPAISLADTGQEPFYRSYHYQDTYHKAVVCLQTEHMPTADDAICFAKLCNVNPTNLFLLVHCNSSLAASVQVSARIVEQTMNKMLYHKFDLNTIVYARGWCMVAPVVRNELAAMGRINDCLRYGGEADFWVDGDDSHIEAIIDQLVTQGTPNDQTPFAQLYKEANYNFQKMSKAIHSPAKVQIFNMRTGKVHIRGEIQKELLQKSLLAPLEGS